MDSKNILQEKLSKLPHLPGVYKMISEEGKIIYVGKAKDLKKRVSSYFQNKDHPIRTQKLVENIFDVDWIEVNSELEALILETNLIKELMPKYNILMKDGKNFCYLKITLADNFPRIEIVRQIIKDGSKYYGPKTSMRLLEDNVKILQEIYPIVYNNIYRVDGYPKKVDYSSAIKDLPGVSNQSYMEAINSVMDFFEGKYEKVHKSLQETMMKYASLKQFEAAAKIRDYLNEFKKIHETQIISEPSEVAQDVFGYKEMNEKTYITLFQIRNGKLIGHENLIFNGLGSEEELIEGIITQYYENTADYPKEIILPFSVSENEDLLRSILESWFEKEIGKKIKVILPQKGKKSKLIDLACQNAESFAKLNEEKEGKDKEKLKIAFSEIYESIFGESEKDYSIFKHMECFDISHFGGTNQVASMSVFVNGASDKKQYRLFNVKSLSSGEIDDFKAMNEVLDRRLKHIEEDILIGRQNDYNKNLQYQFEKLTKKTLEKYGTENPDLFEGNLGEMNLSKNQIFVVKKGIKIVGTIFVQKFSDKIFEIDFSKISDKQIIKDFLVSSISFFPEKQIWAWDSGENENLYIESGFKKLKTIVGDLKKDRGLVPEEIANISDKKSGMFFSVTYKKQKKLSDPPTFILIDGGKGQLSSAEEAFKNNGWEQEKGFSVMKKKIENKELKIVLISIAKKNEEIFGIGKSNCFDLKNNCEGSFLLQRLRDEAHRFAVTSQNKKRDKGTLNSEIDNIPGIGELTKFKLFQKFGSLKGILDASDDELLEIVNKKVLSEIRKM